MGVGVLSLVEALQIMGKLTAEETNLHLKFGLNAIGITNPNVHWQTITFWQKRESGITCLYQIIAFVLSFIQQKDLISREIQLGKIRAIRGNTFFLKKNNE